MPAQHKCALLSSRPNNQFGGFSSESVGCVSWFRKLRLWCSISENHPKCQQYFIGMAAITKERRRQFRLASCWIIHPFSDVRFMWELLMIVIYLIAFVTIPFMICFIIMDYEAIYYDKINLAIYAICWLDIIINCITGIHDSKSMKVVFDQGAIIKSYMKGFLVLDIVTSLPYDHITAAWRKVPGPGASLIVAVINVLPTLKIIRYFTLHSYILQLFAHSMNNNWSYQMSTTLLLSGYVIYWFSCFCYIIPIFTMYILQVTIENCPDCWISNIQGQGIAAKFRHALYIVVDNFTASGYGIFPPIAEGHSLFCTFLLLAGRIFECYITIIFLQIKSNSQEPEAKFQEIINQLSAYIWQKQLPPYMKKRLLLYYRFRFRKSYFRERMILSSLPDQLRQEIVLYSCQRLVENVAIFQNLPQDVLTSIVTNLKLELYLPNDIIVKASTHGDCMFFLSSGTVAVFTPTGKEICHLDDGAYFGEVALLVQDQRRVASVVAIDICEVYRLDRRDFRKSIAVQSDLFAKIERIATERMEKTVLVEEQHKRLLQQKSGRFSSLTRGRYYRKM
ncbi:potassium/sodium hyperpolarization-activated cyclic nucleotide-gated channel 1 [Cephus cinctus]|uniref:Potassium/sodium hyperpolarization-activated cyclic nucleotide-gated channel 1 n=1 Tax=Cephus cinctus TaxID=211228 RepID=A0AAJ7FFH4_CEPCN|nr:potassium/sodium hyperpolarization-activated cyclic nucleotide-gated channel 1 [Cephus cinctus]